MLTFRWTRVPQFPQPRVRAPLRRWLLEYLRVLLRELLRGFPKHFRSPGCVPFSTHRQAGVPVRIAIAPDSAPPGCTEAIFDVPQKMTQNKNACFLGFCRPKILGREKYEPHGINVCVPLRFRRSRGNKNSKHVLGPPPCPVLLGFSTATHATGARMELKRAA